MFDPAERSRIRDELVARAREEDDIAGAAYVGSAARGTEDRWSDIDLVLQLVPGADEPRVVEEWTRWIRAEYGLADCLDVFAADGVRYRVFLLPSALQIDLSFWPHELFRATEDGFRLLFGTPDAPTSPGAVDTRRVIGMAWLYALHARSALARGRTWQTILMLDDLRDQIVALQCLRAGLNPWHGREVDRLDAASLDRLTSSRAASTESGELARAKRALIALLLAEVAYVDGDLAASLRPPLEALAE